MKLGTPFAITSALIAATAQGGVEGSALLQTTGYTRATFQSLELEGKAGTSGKIVDAMLDAKFGFEKRLDQFGTSYNAEFSQFYVGTSREFSPDFSIAFGRKLESWSKLDDSWQLGIWQPRYRWDVLNPDAVGLTGLFVEVERPFVRVDFHVSPGFIPERGASLELADGRFHSSSPFTRSPPSSFTVMGEQTSIHYDIRMPEYSQLLLKPGASVRARFGEKLGAWVAIGGANKPMNQILLSYDGSLNLANDRAEVELHPRSLRHTLMTVETGHQFKSVSTWASYLGDHPEKDETPAAWTSQRVAPSHAFSIGAELKPSRVSVSLLRQSGGNAADAGKDTDGRSSAFEGRYPFQTAIRLGAIESLGRGFRLATNLLYDIGNEGMMFSSRLGYQIHRSWEASLSGDLLISAADRTSADFIGQYRGNDRFRAGVTYAF